MNVLVAGRTSMLRSVQEHMQKDTEVGRMVKRELLELKYKMETKTNEHLMVTEVNKVMV
jgi:hypothetical protein